MSGIVPNSPKPVESTRLLIGEGVEEVLFFEALASNLDISDLQIETYNGKGGLGPYLKALKSRSGFARVEKLLITRDADDNARGAAESVDALIAQAGFLPTLTVRKFILPGNGMAGALETLCLQAFDGQPIRNCIEEYLLCAANATGVNHASTTHKAKARIHAWLAAQTEPDKRLGQAAKASYINWDSSAFDNLKQFLQNTV